MSRGWELFLPCADCGHPGFSHDNWAECAECPCEMYDVGVPDED